MSARPGVPIRWAFLSPDRSTLPLLTAAWSVLMLAVFLLPAAHRGDALTRNTVRVALLSYLLAVVLMFRLDSAGWSADTLTGKAARLGWTLGWLAYLVHLAMALQYYHGWSHANAMQHVQDVSGFGPGIFVSHLFTLLWTLDVAWWQFRPVSYAFRPAWVGWFLHGFMAFIIFNGTVVYETGFIRWAGVVLFLLLAVCFLMRFAPTLRGDHP